MANSEHIKILNQGIDAWNKWRADNPDIKPDLVEANLMGADLRGADLTGVDITRADMRGVNLTGANLIGSDLRAADLSRANISRADLSRANISRANLNKVNFRRSDLTGAYLSGANISEAYLTRADLSGVDLSGAKVISTVFSSRQSLKKLAYPLSDEQMSGAIFEDELEQKKAEHIKVEQKTIKQKIKIAVENPQTYSEINFSSQDLTVMVTALIEYYERRDNDITEEERNLKNQLKNFGAKLESFTEALEKYPDNKNIDELGLQANKFKHEKEMLEISNAHDSKMLDKDACNKMLGKWNGLNVSMAGAAILKLMNVI